MLVYIEKQNRFIKYTWSAIYDLHDGGREESHTVSASLTVMDVSFPTSIHMLL